MFTFTPCTIATHQQNTPLDINDESSSCGKSHHGSEIDFSFSCANTTGTSREREREVSSVGSSTSTRSELKQAKRERRQKLKEGEVADAFTGNELGESCEDEGMTEIVVPCQLMSSDAIEHHEWATPMLGSPQPVVVASATSPSTSKRANLRRGKRDLMKSWLATPLGCDGSEIPPIDPTSPLSPSQLVLYLPMQDETLMCKIESSTEYVSQSQTGVCTQNSPLSPHPTETTSLGSLSDAHTTIDTGTELAPPRRETVAYHGHAGNDDEYNALKSTRTNKLFPHNNLTIQTCISSEEHPSSSKNNNTVPPKEGSHNNSSSGGGRHSRPRDIVRSIHALRSPLSLTAFDEEDGGYDDDDDDDDDDPLVHTVQVIDPPLHHPPHQLAFPQELKYQQPHSPNIFERFASDISMFSTGDDKYAPMHYSPRNQPPHHGGDEEVDGGGLDDSRGLSLHDVSCNFGASHNNAPLQVSGLRLQSSTKGAVYFNMDVYNLDTWDSEVMGPFAVDDSVGVVGVRPECGSVVPSAANTPRSVLSHSPNAMTPSSAAGAGASTTDHFQSSLSVLAAYFEEGRAPALMSDDETSIMNGNSINSQYMPVGALRRPFSPDGKSVSGRQFLRSHSSSAFSMTSSYSMLRRGGNSSNSALPDHKCRAYLHQLGASYTASCTPSILLVSQTTMQQRTGRDEDEHLNIVSNSPTPDEERSPSESAATQSPEAPDHLSPSVCAVVAPHNPTIPFHPVPVFGGAEDSFMSMSVNAQKTTFSDVVGKYVTVDTLVHKATSYTEQLANPTSGTGLRKFRREHDRWQPSTQ